MAAAAATATTIDELKRLAAKIDTTLQPQPPATTTAEAQSSLHTQARGLVASKHAVSSASSSPANQANRTTLAVRPAQSQSQAQPQPQAQSQAQAQVDYVVLTGIIAQLEKTTVDTETLRQTGIGKRVNAIRKHCAARLETLSKGANRHVKPDLVCQQLQTRAASLVERWRKAVELGEAATAPNNRAAVPPSSHHATGPSPTTKRPNEASTDTPPTKKLRYDDPNPPAAAATPSASLLRIAAPPPSAAAESPFANIPASLMPSAPASSRTPSLAPHSSAARHDPFARSGGRSESTHHHTVTSTVHRAIPSLTAMCQHVIATHLERFTSFGNLLPLDALLPALQRCTPRQLVRVELNNVDLVGSTDDIWKRLTESTFPGVAPQPNTSWRETFFAQQRFNDSKVDRIGARLRALKESSALQQQQHAVQQLKAPANGGFGTRSPTQLYSITAAMNQTHRPATQRPAGSVRAPMSDAQIKLNKTKRTIAQAVIREQAYTPMRK
ncbi:hypothetical protein CAOG_02827 [Capsaspora owczarzaki ATCC 30864]|uniref:TFIIS N-terminal domain-containing protein n=1 Tax=Capsaspora owczarzaki (strain ATCC 30864) TaxID=595528 RepID=A0A0D2VN84_CAPO3|nr:hypothetical protein CAOG_02827 [Capsaspora owczarzaki ATCC 30864]KJE91732.1 hypothetical protein CAOG_002827 [Capsaspora owczarzaki ATCC 30864]|eukprot:XP_004348640.1 hypothetical protein CAOG_02827 [Capsaspora owczarzaki ATCC 30864]